MSEPSLNLTNVARWKGDAIALFVFKGDVPKALAADAAGDGFKGIERETLWVKPSDAQPAARVLLIGLGARSEFSLETLRRGAPMVLREAERIGRSRIALRLPGFLKGARQADELQAIAEGLCLGSYRFNRYRKEEADAPKPLSEIDLLVPEVTAALKSALARGRSFSRATTLARNLVNEPPSRMNPEKLAAEAKAHVTPPLTIQVLETAELKKLGMEALLGVGSGGAVAPRLVEVVYRPSAKPKKAIALVGKGITFDSGGLSLKPAQSMETMKDDMSGAAAVLGVMSVLPELKPRVEVRGYLALAENMPGGRAQKPGDIVKAFNGKTIEVLNTDAEGRLVLADALSYACSKKPDVVIDIATLTGACVVALGHRVAAILSPAKSLVNDLFKAASLAGEKFWELPLEPEYAADIKSKVADVKNIGSRRGEAGTIIGGLFLKEFVDAPAWAHLDIAGPSWTDSDQPYCPTGGTGHPVRTLLHYLEQF